MRELEMFVYPFVLIPSEQCGSISSSSSYREIVEWTVYSSLYRKPVYKKSNFKFKPETCPGNWPCVTSSLSWRGWINIYSYIWFKTRYWKLSHIPTCLVRCSYGVVVNMHDCGIVVSKFKLQLFYCIHFQTNALGKSINLLIPIVLNS